MIFLTELKAWRLNWPNASYVELQYSKTIKDWNYFGTVFSQETWTNPGFEIIWCSRRAEYRLENSHFILYLEGFRPPKTQPFRETGRYLEGSRSNFMFTNGRKRGDALVIFEEVQSKRNTLDFPKASRADVFAFHKLIRSRSTLLRFEKFPSFHFFYAPLPCSLWLKLLFFHLVARSYHLVTSSSELFRTTIGGSGQYMAFQWERTMQTKSWR